ESETAQHGQWGLKHDPQVKKEAAAFLVLKVKGDHICDCHPVSRVHLVPTSNAREHVKTAALLFIVKLCFIRHCRPWPHNAHLSTEYIPELRKFIKAGAPQQTADAGDAAGIGVSGLENGVTIFVHAGWRAV